jgi:phospho-N-acetylmuramoyl-pentapeptide-transferase
MLFHLFYPLRAKFGFFNVFRYPSFRMIAAAVAAFFIVYFMIPWFIRRMTGAGIGQPIRDDGPQTHLVKSGTPTMGGLVILAAIIVPVLMLCDLRNYYVWTVVAITLAFGLIGLADDVAKIRGGSSRGIPGKLRLLLEFGISGAALVTLIAVFNFNTHLSVPFIKTEIFEPDLGWLYPFVAMVFIVGTANAVNLTDGLDGLAIGPTIVSAATFLFLAYGTGTIIAGFNIAEYLKIPHIAGVEELSVVCGAIAGAGIGFLWYNAYPAEIFMGDVGSLSIGGALGTIAVLTKMEVLSIIVNGLFVAEAISVIVQVASYQTTGKRVFRMAPLHHHFEKKGWAEPKVIVRFWIIAGLLSLAAIGTLKIR